MYALAAVRRARPILPISVRTKTTNIEEFFVGSKVRLRTETRKYPLNGIRVALLNRPAIGEFTAHILEDFGADVAKFCEISSLFVDNDPNFTRSNPPYLSNFAQIDLSSGELVKNYVYASTMRRLQPPHDEFDVKKSHGCLIDLTTTEDVNLIRNISGNVDILIDYLHGGRLEQVGLDPEALLKANSQLIIARITGYGQNGPLGHVTAGDATMAALSGTIHDLDGGNDHVLNAAYFEARALAMAGRSNCVSALILALYDRESSGKGQIIDMSMTESIAYLDRVAYETKLDIAKPFNRFYVTSDKKFVAVSILSKGQQDRFLEITGVSPDGNVEANIVGRMTQKSCAEWMELLKDVSSVVEVLNHKNVGSHKQHRERNAFNYDNSTNLWVAKLKPRFVPQ